MYFLLAYTTINPIAQNNINKFKQANTKISSKTQIVIKINKI